MQNHGATSGQLSYGNFFLPFGIPSRLKVTSLFVLPFNNEAPANGLINSLRSRVTCFKLINTVIFQLYHNSVECHIDRRYIFKIFPGTGSHLISISSALYNFVNL